MVVLGGIKRWGTAGSSMLAGTSSSSSSSALAQRLLNDKTYNIEFHGYLSNHVKHAIIALDKLDAPDERIQEYWNGYTQLTPYSLALDKLHPSSWYGDEANLSSSSSFVCTDKEWKEWRGNKVHWQEMVKFLDRQGMQVLIDGTHDDNDNENEGGAAIIASAHQLVRKYVPDLLPGIGGALAHGTIHLGWAIDANNYWMILEGLAYLNFCYLPIETKELQSNAIDESSPTESILRIAKEFWKDTKSDHHGNDGERSLQESWIEVVKSKYDENFHPELVPAGFQWQLAKVLNEPHDVAVKLPSWFHTLPMDELFEKLYKTIVLIYLGTRTGNDVENDERQQIMNGNFIVLHLLTSLWGLEQVCRVIISDGTEATLQQKGTKSDDDNDDDVDEKERMIRQALEYYWSVAICLLSTSSNGFPTVDQIEKVLDDFPVSSDEVSASSFDWTDVVRRGCAEEEEHNIKLVYVCRELWQRYGPWKGFSEAAQSFTLTPNIGPSQVAFSDGNDDSEEKKK